MSTTRLASCLTDGSIPSLQLQLLIVSSELMATRSTSCRLANEKKKKNSFSLLLLLLFRCFCQAVERRLEKSKIDFFSLVPCCFSIDWFSMLVGRRKNSWSRVFLLTTKINTNRNISNCRLRCRRRQTLAKSVDNGEHTHIPRTKGRETRSQVTHDNNEECKCNRQRLRARARKGEKYSLHLV